MSSAAKVAVVTPYYKEADDVLRTCLASVGAQTYPHCRHFVVADGFPNPLVGEWDTRHIVLPSAHGDNGNLARAVGSIAAAAEGYDAIAFLDADNWYQPAHIASLVELGLATGAAVCTSGRSMHRLDGSLLYVDQRESNGESFADTSTLLFFRPAFDLLPLWASMPRSLTPICDTVMWQAVLQRGLRRAHTGQPTMAFRTQYEVHYINAGEAPPPDAKEMVSTVAPALIEFKGLLPDRRAALLSGVGNYDRYRRAV